MGTSTSSPLASSIALKGIVHGGPNPIVGATVTLYSTGNTGYGTGSTVLASTTTAADGSFAFPANTCTANSEVYATAAAGNTGANAANPNSLLLAALGDCANIDSSTVIWISEVTTVAAGYALSNFTSVSGSGASATVSIGAPSTNATSTPHCSGSGPTMTCTAAGLKHAFANALNLANSVSLGGVAPTGQAYAVTPSDASGYAPIQLINTLANILQTCVNSTGGTAGDASTCGALFTNTIPPTTSTTSPTTPTNTLQAILNLAKFPTMTPSQVTGIFNIAGATGFYQPTLAAAPTDFSVAIVYKGITVGGSTTALGYPYFLTTDVNDDVYVAQQTSSSAGPVTIAGFGPDGTGLFVGPSVATSACSAGSACVMAPDTTGHLWLPLTSGTTSNVYEISTSDGTSNPFAVGTNANSAAVDRYNSVFISSATTTGDNLYESTVGAGGISFGPAQVNGVDAALTTANPEYLGFDGNGDLWVVNYATAATATTYLANTGTTSTAFANAPVVATESSTAGSPYSVVFDSSNNGYVNNTKTLYMVPSGATAPSASYTIQFVNGTTTTAASSARYSTIDGAGNIFLPDNNIAGKMWVFYHGTGNFVYLAPCASSSATATTCATGGAQAVYTPRNDAIDATGSIWVANSPGLSVSQIIGTADPAWGQLSYGKQGVRP